MGGGGGFGIEVAALLEGVEQAFEKALLLLDGGKLGKSDGRFGWLGIADQLIEGDGDGLAEIHGAVFGTRGDAEEPLAMAEFVIAEAELFRTEDEGDGSGGECLAEARGSLLEGKEREAELAVVIAGSADHQTAVAEGFGQGGVLLGRFKDGTGFDSGFRLAEGDLIGVDDAEIEEAEIAHGPCGGADVQRIARIHQHHTQVGLPGGVYCSSSIT